MTASHSSHNHIFIGIDVGGASFDVAWHRGDCAQYANRPDAIAALRCQASGRDQPIIRIVIEPTGGYEKPLVKHCVGAGLPVEMVHTSRFNAYRIMVGAKAKSDSSDARLLAAYAAAPTTCVAARPHHVELPRRCHSRGTARAGEPSRSAQAHDPCRDLQARHRPQCQAAPGDHAHLDVLKAEDAQTHKTMLALVRARVDMKELTD